MAMSAKLEQVTPKKATAWLKLNKKNRPRRDALVRKYAHDITTGQWGINGATIVFNGDGRVLDGQHRLAAVEMAGVAAPMIVVRGVETNVFHTIDTGKPRSLGDVLDIRGEVQGARVASIVRWRYRIDNGCFVGGAKVPPLTHSGALEFLGKHRELAKSAELVAGLELKKGMIQPGLLGAYHSIFSLINQRDADTFVRRLADGEGLRKDSPIYVLRERLLSEATTRSGATRVSRPKVKAAMLIKAWNCYRAKETADGGHTIRYRRNDQFPTPI